MKIHANARTCRNSRKLLVKRVEEEGWSLMVAAEAAGISERSARKWLSRWRTEGEAGLFDRSSAPRRIPHRTPDATVEAIGALRRLRMTAAEIAEILGLALSTVSLWLKKIGLGKRSRLQPPEPPNRYERSRPGELIHIDVKKLGRFGVAGKRAIGNRSSSPGLWLGVLPTSVSMTPRASPRGGTPRRARRDIFSLPATGGGLVCRARREGRAGDDRQRLALRFDNSRRHLPRAGDQAFAHPALQASH
jgi:transposase